MEDRSSLAGKREYPSFVSGHITSEPYDALMDNKETDKCPHLRRKNEMDNYCELTERPSGRRFQCPVEYGRVCPEEL